MLELLPVLNCRDARSVEERLRWAEQLRQSGASWVHLDVADGRFTFHRTWHDPQGWPGFKSKLQLEVHLMAEEPEKLVPAWLEAGARRIIVHYEALFDPALRPHPVDGRAILSSLAEQCATHHCRLILALNPETSVVKVNAVSDLVHDYQILAVTPGLPGQHFHTLVLDKIRFLRAKFPDATIEVDGGINVETAALCRAAGANVLTSDTFLAQSPDPHRAFTEIRDL